MKESFQQPSFRAALRFWFKLGWISFGGTAAHIAIMHSALAEKKRWISNRSFPHALSHCMILPGPEAQQLAITKWMARIAVTCARAAKARDAPVASQHRSRL